MEFSMKKHLKKRAIAAVLAVLLITLIAMPVSMAATDNSQQYKFTLSEATQGETVKAEAGDTFTLELTLTRTDVAADGIQALYSIQDEIQYSTEFLRVDNVEVLAETFNSGSRDMSNGVDKKVLIYRSTENDGTRFTPREFPAVQVIARITFTAVKNGKTDILQVNQKVITEVSANVYESVTNNVSVTIGSVTDPDPDPDPVEYAIRLAQPTGATIASNPADKAAAGETVTLTAYRTAAYNNYTVTWSAATPQGAVAVTEISGNSASFLMPSADVTVSVTLTAPGGGGGGGGGGLVSGTGNETPPSDIELLDEETPLAGVIFLDVPATHWAYDYIYYLSEHGFVNGKEPSVFAPSDSITRAEFVTILSRMCGDALPHASAAPFKDVAAGSYYGQAVAWAYLAGITKGTSDTEFSPNALITRQEMAAMIVRYAVYMQYDFVKFNEKKDFTDSQTILDYAKEFVGIMQQADIISGYEDGSFRPFGNTTRAETAKMLALVHKLMTSA